MTTNENNSSAQIDDTYVVRSNLNQQEIATQNTYDYPTNSWVGNYPSQHKPPNTIRFIFQNLNGIGTKNAAQNMATLISEQISVEADILGMTEHCINTTYHDTHNLIQTNIKHTIPDKVNLQITSSTFQTDTPYLPGGTAISTTGTNVGRILHNHRGGDDMGRWTYITLRRKQQPPLTIFSVYQVNIRPTNDTGITAWHQQRLLLNRKRQSNLHPRQAFINDLIAQVKSLQELQHDILIGGDFNETAEKPNSGLLKLMTATGLLDAWTHRFPTHPSFNTYKRGTKRIDTIICSPTIIPMIRLLGYSPFNWFTNSDHRAIIINISSIALFNESDDTSNFSIQQRAIRSNDKQRTLLYINRCYNHLMENNAIRFLSRLKDFTATPAEVETYDKIITQATESAEKSCKRRRPEFYSTKINSLRIRTTIAHGHYRQLHKYNKSDTTGFQSRLQRAETTIEFKDTPQEAYQVYKELRNQLREASKHSHEIREQELASRINEKHEQGSPDYIIRLKNIKKGEANRRAWQTMKFL